MQPASKRYTATARLAALLFSVWCTTGPPTGHAVPPNPNLWGDSESARQLYAQNPGDPVRQNAGLQPDGIEYVLVLRVDFLDQPGVRPRAEIDRWLFAGDSASLASYYAEASYGTTDLQPGPAAGSLPDKGWYRMPETMSSYGEGRIRVPLYQRLVRDACDAADDDVNFNDYDRDGDGSVDHIIILHAGNDEASSGAPNDIWSILVPDVAGRWDGVGIDAAMVFGEEPDPPTPHLGVWFHEFFHDFGAPETYVNGTLVSEHDSQYCLMGLFGPYQGGGSARDGTEPSHICGYLKWDFDGIPENGRHGWITPVEIDTNTIGMAIPAFSMPDGKPPLYKIDVPDKGGKEFFLIENRSRSVEVRFDTSIPDEGLLIWHIDEALDRSALSVAPRMWLEDPSDPKHFDVSLTITQDAAYSREDGQIAFTPSTNPNSNGNDGSPSGISILDIGPSGALMTFDLFLGDTFEPNDSLIEAFPIRYDVTYDSFLFNAADRADTYRLDVEANDRVRVSVVSPGSPGVRVRLFDADGRELATATRTRDTINEQTRFELLYFADAAQSLFVEIAPSTAVAGAISYALTAARDPEPGSAPPRFTALDIFPNPVPSGSSTHVRMAFEYAGLDRVRMEVFDVAGSKVGEVAETQLATSSTTLEFPASNGSVPLAPGVYFLLVTAESGDGTAKRLAKFAVR